MPPAGGRPGTTGVELPPLGGPLTADTQPPSTGEHSLHITQPDFLHYVAEIRYTNYFLGMKRPRSRSWEPQPRLTPSSKRGHMADRPGTKHQRSQTAGSSFSRPRKQREQFRNALVKLIL